MNEVSGHCDLCNLPACLSSPPSGEIPLLHSLPACIIQHQESRILSSGTVALYSTEPGENQATAPACMEIRIGIERLKMLRCTLMEVRQQEGRKER